MRKILTSILVLVTMFVFSLAVGCESTTRSADVSESSYSVSSDTSFYLDNFDIKEMSEIIRKLKECDSRIDMWEVKTITKQEPVDYGKKTIDLSIKEIDENGQICKVTYETAFVEEVSDVDMSDNIYWEETEGGYVLYRQYMQKYIVHYTNSGINLFPCDVNADCFLETQNGKVLIAGWHSLWVYELKSKTCKCISNEVLDFKNSKGTLSFCDDNHIEWKCDWTKSNQIHKTGRKVSAYLWEDNSQPEFYAEYQKLFAQMQQTVKSDSNFEDEWGKEFEKTFPVYHLLESSLFSGSEFVDFSTNIHFPKPYEQKEGFYLDYKGAADYYDSVFYATWLVDNPKNKLYLYRYGKELIQYKLPKGSWYLLDCDGGSERDLKSIKVLMLNLSNRSMYVVQNGKVKKIQTGLQDTEVIHGEVFWMDAKGRAYQMRWPKSSKSVLLEKNVIGLDSCDGILDIIVSKNDPRATQDQSDKGYFIENIYGR